MTETPNPRFRGVDEACESFMPSWKTARISNFDSYPSWGLGHALIPGQFHCADSGHSKEDGKQEWFRIIMGYHSPFPKNTILSKTQRDFL